MGGDWSRFRGSLLPWHYSRRVEKHISITHILTLFWEMHWSDQERTLNYIKIYWLGNTKNIICKNWGCMFPPTQVQVSTGNNMTKQQSQKHPPYLLNSKQPGFSVFLQIIFFTFPKQKRKMYIYIFVNCYCHVLHVVTKSTIFFLAFGWFGLPKQLDIWSHCLCEQSDLVIKVMENIGLTCLQSSVFLVIETQTIHLESGFIQSFIQIIKTP